MSRFLTINSLKFVSSEAMFFTRWLKINVTLLMLHCTNRSSTQARDSRLRAAGATHIRRRVEISVYIGSPSHSPSCLTLVRYMQHYSHHFHLSRFNHLLGCYGLRVPLSRVGIDCSLVPRPPERTHLKCR